MKKRSFRLSDSKPDAKRDVDDEVAFHLEMRTREFIEQGMTPEEARRQALASFGDVQAIRSDLNKERVVRNQERESRDWWNGIWMDVRYGARLLRRSPIFALVAVLSIAGGLAAGTAIFAFTNALLYRPLGVGDGQNLYRIYTSDRSGRSLYSSSSYPDYEAFHAAKGIFASTCATERIRANFLVNGVEQLHHGEIVSPGCFDALQLPPSIGQYFSEKTATASAVPTPVVISHALWTRRFSSDPTAIGRTVLLNGMSVAVVAVAPQGYAGESLDGGAEFWAPVQIAPVVFPPGVLRDRGARMFTVFARLANGIDREQAQAGLDVMAAQLRRLGERGWEADTTGGTRKLTVLRELDARFAESGNLEIIGGALASVAVIVLIACLNLATMLLARGVARAREMSIRLAIGASRGRVLRQLATESLLIAALGAIIAVPLVAMGVRVFEAKRPAEVPAFDLAIDWRVQAFAVVLAMIAALLFGLAPATHTLRLALAEGLKGGGRASTAGESRLRVPAREALIVVQVAVSIALLLVSTLFVRAREDGAALSPGFNGENVAVVMVHLDALANNEVAPVAERLYQAAGRVKDVDYVSLAGVIPMSGTNIGFHVTTNGGDSQRVFYGNIVSPGYFATLEIPMRSGRDFDRRDREGGARVAIVGETFARSVFGTTNAVGQPLVVDGRPTEVVGVVADVKYKTLSEPFLPLIYLPIDQTSRTRFIIHARVRGGGETLAALDAAIRNVDRRVGVESAKPLRSRIELAMAPERAAQWAGGLIGIVQLGLAVMALWGLVAYAVERRTTEMGVRLALGATPSSLVRLTMRPAGVSILVGVAIGCVLGAAIAKVVQSESVGLAPLDFTAMLPVVAAFTIVAMISAWWPARRAGMGDPVASLRRAD